MVFMFKNAHTETEKIQKTNTYSWSPRSAYKIMKSTFVLIKKKYTMRVDHLMRKSVDMWQSEKSKMSDVKIPAIPMYQKNEKLMSKVTWNNVRSVKKQVNK